MLMLGVVLIAAAFLTLVALLSVFRAPVPPRWTRPRWVGELVTLGIVGAFTLGLASFCAGVYRAFASGLTLLDIGVVALTLGLTVVVWPRLKPRAPAEPALVIAPDDLTDPAPQEPHPPGASLLR